MDQSVTMPQVKGSFFEFVSSWTKVALDHKLKDRYCISLYFLHGVRSWLYVETCLPGVSPNQKTKPFSHSHSFVLIRSAPKQCGCSSVCPLLQHVLVGLPHYFLPLSSAEPCALAPDVAQLHGSHFASLDVAAHPSAPSPTRSHRAVASCPSQSLAALRTLAPGWQSPASLAPFPFVHHPTPLGVSLTSPWPLGHTCRGGSSLPRPSQGHQRAWPVLVVLACRGSPSAPTSTTGIDWPNLLSPMLYMYVSSISDVSDVCCNHFILMLQK
jgi:hypothetical protein